MKMINICWDDRIYIDLKRGQGYTGELEKINRNDLNLTLMVTLKTAAAKKNEVTGNRLLPG